MFVTKCDDTYTAGSSAIDVTQALLLNNIVYIYDGGILLHNAEITKDICRTCCASLRFQVALGLKDVLTNAKITRTALSCVSINNHLCQLLLLYLPKGSAGFKLWKLFSV